MSSFGEALIKSRVSLSPETLLNIPDAVRAHLNKKLLNWDLEFEGVILGYRQLKIMNEKGIIIHESPYVHYNVEYIATYFKPTVGNYLVGSVLSVGEGQINLIVFDLFNAIIPKEQISDQYLIQGDDLTDDQVRWTYLPKDRAIQEQDLIQFCIQKVVFDLNGMVILHGHINDNISAGFIQYIKPKNLIGLGPQSNILCSVFIYLCQNNYT